MNEDSEYDRILAGAWPTHISSATIFQMRDEILRLRAEVDRLRDKVDEELGDGSE